MTDVKSFRSGGSCIWDVLTKSDVSRIATGRTQRLLLHFRTIIRHFATSRRRSTRFFSPCEHSTPLGCARVSRPRVQAEREKSLTSRKYAISHQRSLPLVQTHPPTHLSASASNYFCEFCLLRCKKRVVIFLCDVAQSERQVKSIHP